MNSSLCWFSGPVRSGKTTALIDHLALESQATDVSNFLVFAVNADNRQRLMQQIAAITPLPAVTSTTPLGFFEDEVVLFWPLITEMLQLKAHFPVRLRPETEQALALQFWDDAVWDQLKQFENLSCDRWVRRVLDLLQLAAFSGTPLEEIPDRLQRGLIHDQPKIWGVLGQSLIQWRDWCLDNGLLTYGLITELFWRYLLPNSTYQGHLLQRFQGVMADDVDSYPAITRTLFEVWLEAERPAGFTFNSDGAIRLGLGADPNYLRGLCDDRLRSFSQGGEPTGGQRCQVIPLVPAMSTSLGGARTVSERSPLRVGQSETVASTVIDFLNHASVALPDSIVSLQTSSRAQLLRQTAETIIDAVHSGAVEPKDIAVIGPGLDTIARYTLREILARQDIAVESLQDQRPLNSTAMVRALLTLLALVYPGLGRLVDQDQIAEMLVVLTTPTPDLGQAEFIDPVRAGLLADYCFQAHSEQPRLLPVESFPRWDRLGYQATVAYNRILSWLAQQTVATTAPQPYLTLSPVFILDRAIQHFFSTQVLSFDQLSVLRELIETAQHYWEVDTRLRQTQTRTEPIAAMVGQFIELLRQGTITANPYPVNHQNHQAVMLSTTFQYRMARQVHRWHFWLDAGSALWHGGGAVVLWGAPFFLQGWSGDPLTVEDELTQDQDQLERLMQDLLGRVTERVYLCYSELSVSGQEQAGPLLPLVDAAVPALAQSTITLQS
ncbi:MAG: recombinase family protein [Cyanobacteria bacterium P01_A01_bin.17]